MAYTPDNVQIAKVYFERVPSYSKETLLKSMKDEYRVEYVMKVDRPTTKIVVDAAPPDNIEREEPSNSEAKDTMIKRSSNQENNRHVDMNKIGVSSEIIIEKANRIIKAFPSFNTKSETEKMVFIAELISGKYDNIVFNEKTTNDVVKEISKPIQAYKTSEKI